MTQRIVITAGGSGIGLQMARQFSARGDRVAICDSDQTALKAAQSALGAVLAVQADVTDPDQMSAFFEQVGAEMGGADVVCANAGIGGPAGRIEEIDLQGWRDTLDVNLTGAFLTCQWAARVMQAQGSGLIVLTSSTAGLFGYPFRSPYAVAKWGVIGLMKTLAMELGPAGIRVNALCPGAVEGDRMDRVVAAEAAAKGLSEAEVRAQYVTGVSLRSWVTAEDIANMALFLASPAGAKISGQALAIDGHTETLAP